ncbi:MAG: flavin reductase family protein [Candidatus Eremiobacteraeota bacterium]|nr:flavin reductase family protein [Candidatus Eremiobacteraeota bacterium]
MLFDPATSDDWRPAYKLLTGAVVPRAIAFVSTVSGQGVPNLAPFSFFTAVCAKPPTILFCPMRAGEAGTKKDTLRNLEEVGDFVVNVVTEKLAEDMNRCATDFPYGVSEFSEVGLTPAASTFVRSPRVAESPISMECKLSQVVTVGETSGGGSVVLGEVVAFHVDDELVDDFRIDLEKLAPIGRLAGASYTRVNDLFEMTRVPYASLPK